MSHNASSSSIRQQNDMQWGGHSLLMPFNQPTLYSPSAAKEQSFLSSLILIPLQTFSLREHVIFSGCVSSLSEFLPISSLGHVCVSILVSVSKFQLRSAVNQQAEAAVSVHV